MRDAVRRGDMSSPGTTGTGFAPSLFAVCPRGDVTSPWEQPPDRLHAMGLAERHRRFTVEEFSRMAEAGILHEDDRVELLDGEIVQMTPIGSRHAACVARLDRALTRRVNDRAIVWVQNPLRLSEHDEVYPDVSLLRPRDDFYAAAPPGPGDAFVVVEVAESSLAYDRGEKTAAYARAGVPELWIVDIAAGQVLVRRAPAHGGYRIAETRRRAERIEVAALPGVVLEVDEILPA